MWWGHPSSGPGRQSAGLPQAEATGSDDSFYLAWRLAVGPLTTLGSHHCCLLQRGGFPRGGIPNRFFLCPPSSLFLPLFAILSLLHADVPHQVLQLTDL
ncbi:hypothetical protein Taro_010043 [Colocasia esculenta]|uniref:Uncharacterized protein n=1 Tax=Colocasia esculenta TaxID=4460 RepID=A0A843U7B5_COLES|nr:hypothetical protein [Colocasia esculenta]